MGKRGNVRALVRPLQNLAVVGALVVPVLLIGASTAAGGAAVAPENSVQAYEIRSMWADELGLGRVAGVALGPGGSSLVVADARPDGARLVRVGFGERRLRTTPVARAALGAFGLDDRGRSLKPTELARLKVQDARGAAYDAAAKAWYVLDAATRTVVRSQQGATRRIPLRGLGGERLRGLAVNPANGFLYVANSRGGVYAVDTAGVVREAYDLSPARLADVRGLVFGPSGDNTDDPAALHLYVADAGRTLSSGRIVEIQLVPRLQSRSLALAAAIETGTLVQTIQTWQYSPSSPDPAGVAYDAATDRLLVSDSEVDEMTIYQSVNLYSGSRTGGGVGTGTTRAYSAEPSDAGFRQSDRTLFTADDDRDRVYAIRPGADGKHGTADDTVTSFSVGVHGALDAEGVEYDPVTGHLFVSDGVGLEVYDIDPVNGVFGDADDVVTHFDVAQYGSRDAEGIGIDPQRNTLLVIDPSTRDIYELTKSGALVRTIDLAAIPCCNRLFADITMAPTSTQSDSPTTLSYWIVDRQVDNGADPNENDGKMYEISLSSNGSPPSVSVTAPAEGTTVSGTVTVQASASDDQGVTQVAFSVDGTNIGVDANGADGWSATWSTTGIGDGAHSVTAIATDTAGQIASDSNTVVVDNVDSPPAVSLVQPPSGAIVRGIVTATATATDDKGVAQVAFSAAGVSIGTDTNGADGWSVDWDTRNGPDGALTVTATAVDTSGQEASSAHGVTVDNTGPNVSIAAPAAGATLAGTVAVQASAADAFGVASVRFLVDGVTLATDANGSDGWGASWDTTALVDGAHALTAVARDAAGNETASGAVGVFIDNPNVVVLNVPIQVSSDDADEVQGVVRRTRGDLELGQDKEGSTFLDSTVGLRFAGLSIPPGATITNAYVQFQVDEKARGSSSLVIQAQQADDPTTFTSATNNISSRLTGGSASVSWSPAATAWAVGGAAGPDQRTPDLSAVVQQLVNRSGWAPGNALVLIVTGTGRRTAEAFDSGFPPVLHVEYSR